MQYCCSSPRFCRWRGWILLRTINRTHVDIQSIELVCECICSKWNLRALWMCKGHAAVLMGMMKCVSLDATVGICTWFIHGFWGLPCTATEVCESVDIAPRSLVRIMSLYTRVLKVCIANGSPMLCSFLQGDCGTNPLAYQSTGTSCSSCFASVHCFTYEIAFFRHRVEIA